MSYGNPDLEEMPTVELIKEIRRRQIAVQVMRCPYCNVPINVIQHTCKYKDNQAHYVEGLDKVQIEGR